MENKNQDFENFYYEMKRFVPEDARIVSAQFRGDPNEDIPGKWRARVLNFPDAIDEQSNVYLCVSAMGRNARGEIRRRKENFMGGVLLMIDDIGTGAGSKFPFSVIEPLAPTGLVETSPDNFQAFYFFDSLVSDEKTFDALIRAFIDRQFLGTDTGQAGINRVFRPPAGVNGKAKYGGWRVKLSEWHPERRYSVAAIAEAYGLTLVRERRPPTGATGGKGESMRAFITARAALRSAGMVKSESHDISGWASIVCPWIENHSEKADSGASIRLPDVENGFVGAFRCHHGHCESRGWRDLTGWLAAQAAIVLAEVNSRAAPKITDYDIGEK